MKWVLAELIYRTSLWKRQAGLYMQMEAVIWTKGNGKAGYAIVTLEGIVEAKTLPLGTSAQKVELIALTRALELSHGKRVNVYINSR